MFRKQTAALSALSVLAFTSGAIAQEAEYSPPEGAIEVFTPLIDETVLAGNLYLPEGEGP